MRFLLLLASIALASACSQAAVVSLGTPVGATGGGKPVNASATFVTSLNHVQVTLANLQADPTSAVQCLSGIQFHLSTGQSSGILASSSGRERNIAGDGTYTDPAGAVATGWALGTVGADLKLNLLGTGTAPNHTIIGPPDGTGVYSSANSSITGGSHSPFLRLSAVFEIDVTGVTAASSISSASFQFNTSTGTTVTGQDVPEPVGVLALVLPLLWISRRRQS